MKEILKAIILPAVLAILGMYFTHTYNEARLKADYAKTIHDYLPEIQSENIAVSQAALEILRPILTSRQEEAISQVIKANQKMIIDQADASDESIFMSLDDVVKLNPNDGDELARYAAGSVLRKEALESLAAGEYEEAADKLVASGHVHSDFRKSAEFAQIIKDSLVTASLDPDREIEVLNSIASQRIDIQAPERRKIVERSQTLHAKRKSALSRAQPSVRE